MQRTAQARFQFEWVLPATVHRVASTYAGRRQILGGVYCKSRVIWQRLFVQRADWRSLGWLRRFAGFFVRSFDLCTFGAMARR